MSAPVRVTAEWALWGKPPDARHDYTILECSAGRLGRDEFGQIITRFAPGTPMELPQVTASWFGTGENAHLGLAVQEWSGQQDGMGRDIAITRYFCVPYAQAARGPVSYEALGAAFDGYRLPANGPLTVEVPPLDPHVIAGRVDHAAVSAAALLLTDAPVCVVRGEEVPLLERLRFLDAVAALLPYGLRARLTASTWTDSSVRHRIKLSFAKHAKDGAYTVVWGAPEITAHRHDVVGRYLAALGEGSYEEIVGRLARMTRPLSFKQAEEIPGLLGASAGPTVMMSPWGFSSEFKVIDLLNACADCLEDREYEGLDGVLDQLRRAGTRRFTDEEQCEHRALIRNRGLLAEWPGMSPGLRRSLYELVLAAGCGPELTLDGLEWIIEGTGPPISDLVDAMLNIPPSTPAVTLKLLSYLNGERRAGRLQALGSADLVKAVAGEPVDPEIVEIAHGELVQRGSNGEDPEIAGALRGHGYLAAEVARAYPHDGDLRLRRLVQLLIAAYGPALGRKQFEEVVACPLGPHSAALIVAAASLYGPGAPSLLFSELLGRAGLSDATRREAAQRVTPPPAPPAPRRPFADAVRRWTGGRESPRPERPGHPDPPERSRPIGPGNPRKERMLPLPAMVGLSVVALVLVVVVVRFFLW
ncbi:hypothetical protein GCM10017673_28140 [Streptosporangium violaceochromogenes]|nr:hypothetical protein GCM10017673_28140 [Streptosporangium violaceochromogenes]